MSATLLLSIVAALGVGIGAGYLAVMVALLPFRRNSKPAGQRTTILARTD